MNKPRALTVFGLVLATCSLLDAAPSTAAAPPGRYELTSDTTYDTKTKLTWQREVPSESYAWADAKTYCAGLSLSGTGWRLPNVKELQTIVDETRTSPAIDPTAFPNTPNDWFWSSSPLVGTSDNAWGVFFISGYSSNLVVNNSTRVRCVR